MRPLEVMGLNEIAEETGVKPNTLTAWERRGHLPPRDAQLACGPIWRKSTITTWMDSEKTQKRIERVLDPL